VEGCGGEGGRGGGVRCVLLYLLCVCYVENDLYILLRSVYEWKYEYCVLNTHINHGHYK